jgi:hypothetical protein
MMHAGMRRQALWGLLLMFALPGAALAQRDTTFVVRGVVTDSSGRPLESVEIAATAVGRLTRTDAQGRFTLGDLRGGSNRLLVRRLGWRALDTIIVVDSRSPPQLRLTLVRVAQELQTIRIISQDECPARTLEGFECRRRAGFGAFRDSAEIAALKPVCSTDAVRGMSGLRRYPGMPCPYYQSTTGWRCMRVLVDGRPVNGTTNPIPARMSDVVGVEFYADADKIPEWYRMDAFAAATDGVPTHQTGVGKDIIYRASSLPGRSCALEVFWTHFAPRYDPSLDQNLATTRAMQAHRDSLRPNSARVKPDSTIQKKP